MTLCREHAYGDQQDPALSFEWAIRGGGASHFVAGAMGARGSSGMGFVRSGMRQDEQSRTQRPQRDKMDMIDGVAAGIGARGVPMPAPGMGSVGASSLEAARENAFAAPYPGPLHPGRASRSPSAPLRAPPLLSHDFPTLQPVPCPQRSMLVKLASSPCTPTAWDPRARMPVDRVAPLRHCSSFPYAGLGEEGGF